ncbi:hypothetical protein CSE45_4102 [Citreicella sp. SE45]|nr:hypothetical protein CSE45_4102 [Citreicella sp. SE45]
METPLFCCPAHHGRAFFSRACPPTRPPAPFPSENRHPINVFPENSAGKIVRLPSERADAPAAPRRSISMRRRGDPCCPRWLGCCLG